MDALSFYKQLQENFPHQPTLKQNIALQQLANFVFTKNNNALFLLKGFAGTGKTTLISTLVNNLWKTLQKSILLAPTGKAAKVITQYSNKKAITIHKEIYFSKKQKNGGVKFVLQPNKNRETLFIVDEASMISDKVENSKLFENGSLLNDLLQYIYSGYQCKLLLVGDTAQLPPVYATKSPALDEQHLTHQYNKEIIDIELDEVVRQEQNSGILHNATAIRQSLFQTINHTFTFNIDDFTDITRLIDGYEIQDAIDDAYHKNGKEETAIIVRSNKRANLYNQQIRQKILGQEEQLTVGDYVMVVKNNYFWLPTTSEAGFIANGDTLKILEILTFKEIYGFTFAEVTVKMVDYPNQKPFETVLLLNTLTAETPSLSYEDGNKLYQEVAKDHENETQSYRKFLKIKKNKYFNALQIKFSYAITCHKAQGGQWNTIFIEQPYLPNQLDNDFLRWLYTAVTRAKTKLYLIGFKNDFFT